MRRKLRPLRSASGSSPNGLAMISSSRLAATPRQLGSSAPRKAKSVSTAKVLRERIKRNDDERLPPLLLDCRKWKRKPRPGHKKRCGSPKQRRGHEKHALAEGNKPGTTRGATARPQKLRRPAAPTAHARARGPDPESAKSARTWIRAAKQI